MILEETKNGANVYIQCDYCGNKKLKNYKKSQDYKHHFCCKDCADKFFKGKPNLKNRNRIIVNCYQCGEIFEIKASRLIGERIFCSKECRSRWCKSEEYKEMHKNNKKKVKKENYLCNNCGKDIWKRPCDVKGNFHFCNNSCKKEYFRKNNPNPKKEKIEVKCNNCGKLKYVHESIFKKNKYFFCDSNCYSEFRSKEFFGNKIHNYKGLTTNCSFCEKEITTIEFDLKRNQHIYCSPECYWRHKKILLGGFEPPQFAKIPKHIKSKRSRERNIKNYKEGRIKQAFTKPHQIISGILDELQIRHENECPFKYYICDIYIPEYNKIIEIQGDWFHANPLKYSKDDLHDIQKKTITRDKRKKTYLKRYRYIDILYIWEDDIKNNLLLCKQLIEMYLQNDELVDYHSFNYELFNDELKLKDTVVKPYFIA